MRLVALLSALFLSHSALASGSSQSNPAVPVAIAVHDSSSAPVRSELVIVQNLDDHEKELVRALTNGTGNIPSIQLSPGLYRAIATAPYGIWETKVQEFHVDEVAVQLVLSVDPMPTHGHGDIVTVGTPKMSLHLVDAFGKPVAGASVLARDREATLYLERWYKTDTAGNVNLEMVADPLVVVVVCGKVILTRELSSSRVIETIQLP